ncbi:hypothetical protein H4CHR_02755 [Variovorax sp. PBS-H4]|uniref:hypothetical protein n=1 Tax=Variovorax sp. PBS-H4 TaxID=434008 RepID=UPI00131795A6|nr:hypothetical protein [Variovorax sp. PBS-H4]VTU31184.1 hypothetical protein H4CHR_02755 [Variovorax sp. PBS-H4]
MGKKIGNNNPPQSFESLAHVFQDVLDAAPQVKDKKTYFVGEKTKDKCEIDGVERGDITYLSHKKAKHGAAAAAYRLSGRRQNDYKEARIYLEGLIERAENSDPKRYRVATSSLRLVLARSKSKGYIDINAIRNDVQVILNGVKETTQKSAEALKNDLRIADDSISHFLNDIEAIRSVSTRKVVIPKNIREENKLLLGKISSINKQAESLRNNKKITSQLRLKRPSFTVSASSAAEEVTAQDLLDKIADWPGPQLQLDLANFFACAKSGSSERSAELQQASKRLLLSLAEQESILSLISNEFLNTIENADDRRNLQNLRNSAKQLLSDFHNPDLPFGRLKKLALAGYHWPEETAKQVVSQRDEFFRSLLGPIAGDPAGQQPAIGNGQPQPLIVPPAGSLPPVGDLPPLPVNMQPAAGNGQPPPYLLPIPNGAPPPLNVPAIPEDLPPPLPASLDHTESPSAHPGVKAEMARIFRPREMPPPEDLQPPPVNVQLAAGIEQPPLHLPPIPNGAPPPLNVPAIPEDLPPPLPGPMDHTESPSAHPGVKAEMARIFRPREMPPPEDLPPPPVIVEPAAGNALPPILNGLPPPLPVTAGASPPPADEPPLAPHLAQAASVPPLPNVAQSAAGVVPVTGGLPLETSAPGKFVAKRVAEFTNPSPEDQDDALPPADLPPPPAGEPTSRLLEAEASGQLNPAQKAAAAMLSAALDIPPLPEGAPPPLPGNSPPPVFSGVLPPSDLPPLPGDVRKPRPDDTESSPADPRAKAALAELPPLTSAAKLLADLASSDQTYLMASKVDDGTGHKVVTKKGKVLFLKASSGQEKEAGLRSLITNKLRGRRDAQYRNTRKALAALLEDTETRGLIPKENGATAHAATILAHSLEIGKNGIQFDKTVRENVITILAENVKRQQDIAERQNLISMLIDQSKEPQSKNPEAAIDGFSATNGSDFEKNKKEIFFKKLDDHVGSIKPPVHAIDESSLSSVDQWNYEFIRSVDHFTSLAEDIKKMITRPEHLNEGDHFFTLPLSFDEATRSFVEKNMPGDAGIFTGNILNESTVVFSQGLVTQVNLLMGVISIDDLVQFKGGMGEITRVCEKAFRQLEFLARLFTNEQYLAQVPIEGLDLLRRYGEALQEVAVRVLDPKGPYIAFYRMSQAAGTSPETAMPYFRIAFELDKERSPGAQAGESKPPSRPLPPIPAGLSSNPKLGPPPAELLPLPTSGVSPQSDAVETT